MMVAIIAAMTKDRVIGKKGRIPWNIPEDLEHFKNTTSGNTVIMGRKTFESLGKALPNRNNIVISTSMQPIDGKGLGADVCASVKEALERAKSYGKDIFIIGGSQIYHEFLTIADKMYISYIKKDYEGDTYFPTFDESQWVIEKREDHPDFELVVYRRKRKIKNNHK